MNKPVPFSAFLIGGHSGTGHTQGAQSLFAAICYSSAEKAMAPHSSTLAWKILWTEEPGRLQSMGSLRVGYD